MNIDWPVKTATIAPPKDMAVADALNAMAGIGVVGDVISIGGVNGRWTIESIDHNGVHIKKVDS